ncbi:DNA polymerase III subunit gamma and tau [Arthrobacter sp. NPDC092385]|uniref:DNA polymerase III subunit gamma and tau n=1 Tax=Arthrobacter sp. NPDC092385 TaxID=3363943 RepID=UPI00381F1599
MSTALYRRYRPETFADVIGQEHVTEPLMAAIDKDRINHAYLFSGPRGCGKTTSARILARCLNCAQGPTSTPCGTCDSCVELARNGSGSLDVIEIDAASHGGVDDARDLRERATFAPVRDRFKIFIIDEAHMVTSAGFNALLKIVEEPPEHILFIFATTEPDKVIGTIRSRTHHYPFRLVPPEPLMAYLELLCHQENVPVAPGVLSLVIRAGGGSVRDSLSVLDQLMAGAGENGLDYELAVSLLGYTHATLLDDVVDSVAAGDAATVFNAVDRVIQTGHDPRRFVEDLLERFRDLIVINAVPEGAASILRGVPDDQLNRMRTQANQLGAGELSRAADVTNSALTEMTGATSPRLHLELLCARLLLPAADATARGTLARVDRIERRLEYAAGTPAVEADEAPRPPARPRLHGVPRTAEEAAARWSLPSADTAAPAVPATAQGAAPGTHSPAVPAAARVERPAGTPSADSSPDWGGSWGVSNTSAFSDAADGQSKSPAAAGPAPAAGQPSADAATTTAQDSPAAGPQVNPQGEAVDNRPAQVGLADAPPAATGESAPSSRQAGQPAASPGQQAGAARGQEPAAARNQAGAPAEATRSGAQWSTPSQHGSPQEGQPPVRPVQDGPAQHGPGQGAPMQPGQVQPGQGGPAQDVPAQGMPEQSRQAAPRPESGHQGQPAASGGNVEMVRRAWPEIMDEVARIKRATWLIVNVAAKPRSFEGNQLVLAFANQGNAIGFQRGPHMDNVKQAIHKVLGLTCSIEAVHDAGGSGESGPKVPAGQPATGSNPGPVSPAPSADPHGARQASPGTAQAPVGGVLGGHSGPVAEASPQVEGRNAPGAGSSPAPAPRAGEDRSASSVVSAPGTAESGSAASPPGASPVPASATPPRSPGTPDTARTPGAPSTSGAAGSPASATPPGAPGSADPAPGSPASSTAASPGPSHTAGRAAGQPVQTDPQPDRGTAGSGSGKTRWDAPTAVTPRGAARASAQAEPSVSEAVSAWDPSMSDDSWALVEPPEEAFDPGPGWGSVPEDPFERRAPAPVPAPHGSQAGRPGSAPVPTSMRASEETRQADSDASRKPGPVAAASPPEGAGAPRPAIVRPTGPPDTEPAPSRSVVWSPAVQSGAGSTAATTKPSPASSPPGPMTAGGAVGMATRGQGSVARPSGVRQGTADTEERPASAEHVRQKPVSRYQQLLDEAERKRAEEAAAARGTVDLRFVEDEPSADDETIEESGLVGRTAIERILNGRLVEERSVDGQ